MKKYNLLYTLFIFLAVGCTESFLDTSPKSQITEDIFYKTDDQMFQALVAAYAPLRMDYGCQSYTVIGEVRSDNCKTGGGGAGDMIDLQVIEDYTNTPSNPLCLNYWTRGYTGIYRCNSLLNQTYDSPVVKVYRAEAKFLKAWYYFDLLRTFGPVPIINETYYPEGFKFQRSTRDEIYAEIIKNLEEALPVLIAKHPDAQKGRITQSAANALLGKTYMYMADWKNDDKTLFDKAVPYFKAVMNSGNYALFTDYSKLFAMNMENNSESIFEIQRSTLGQYINWGASSTGMASNYWVQFSGPRGLNNNNPDYNGGWGFVLPQKDLYNYYLADDTIRRKATILTYDDLVTKPNKTLPADKKVTWDLGQYNSADFAGYVQKKYPLFKNANITGTRELNRSGNDRIIRYAEVYLLLAEAYLRGNGSEVEAKKLINELRQKHVYMGAATYDGVDQLLAKYPTRFKNTLDVLWYERRVELAGEGDRWFDLVRTGRMKQVMSAIWGSNVDDHDIYLPISDIETGASNGSLTAYPKE